MNREFFSVSLGPFNSTLLQALVQIYWGTTGTALNDFIKLERLKLEVGKEPTPFVYPTLHDLKNWSDRFYQTFEVETVNGTIWVPFGQHMHTTPTTVTASVGTVGTVTNSGFKLTHTSAATSTITASAWL